MAMTFQVELTCDVCGKTTSETSCDPIMRTAILNAYKEKGWTERNSLDICPDCD